VPFNKKNENFLCAARAKQAASTFLRGRVQNKNKTARAKQAKRTNKIREKVNKTHTHTHENENKRKRNETKRNRKIRNQTKRHTTTILSWICSVPPSRLVQACT